MKIIQQLFLILALSGLYYVLQDLNSNPIDTDREIEILRAYQKWKTDYSQNINGEEEEYRYQQFRQNYIFIQDHNESGDQLKLGINQYAGMSNEEFQARILLRKKASVSTKTSNKPYKSDNIDIDWRKKGAVFQTQNQGSCGSCWAFSSIGGLQGLRYLVDGVLDRLSAQQLVSCIPKQYLDPGAKDGCGGSEPKYAYTYTNQHGIQTWEDYPYVSGKGEVPSCHHEKKDSVFFNKGTGSDHGTFRIAQGDVASIKKNIQNQPLSIAVAAGNIFFQFYRKGILKNPKCGNALDHSILLVGLHDVEDDDEPYWIVQNSWGDSWGENGFGKVAVTEGDGVCGINMEVDVPTSVNQKKNDDNENISYQNYGPNFINEIKIEKI